MAPQARGLEGSACPQHPLLDSQPPGFWLWGRNAEVSSVQLGAPGLDTHRSCPLPGGFLQLQKSARLVHPGAEE
ncbi:unnamed protein product [Rangifer tarandus platyrhynchus]|uniref:Uncharacterized protein n=1 Tax=Rangifer tarandus platyrhynchus TaxID=3082113 RepID=A0AC59Z608_RANTA